MLILISVRHVRQLRLDCEKKIRKKFPLWVKQDKIENYQLSIRLTTSVGIKLLLCILYDMHLLWGCVSINAGSGRSSSLERFSWECLNVSYNYCGGILVFFIVCNLFSLVTSSFFFFWDTPAKLNSHCKAQSYK